ncbi:MAG: transposase [FCB group bacterium]|nr:transposase [FCB group bacterium]
MIRVDSCQQDPLIDPFDYLGPKRKDLLKSGWAEIFRKDLFRKIPVDEIKCRFHDYLGRPTKELRTVLSTLVLQQMFDLTDRETVHQLAFNIEWHYALNQHLEDDETKYLCERTLRTYRLLMMDLEIDTVLFRLLTDTLLDRLNISTRKQRLDSTHIRSDMRRLSRIELFRKTIKKFLRVMSREHPRLLKKNVDVELVERYLGKKKGYFSKVKPSEAKVVLQQVAEDLLVLVEGFGRHRKIRGMKVFGLLRRVLNEQCDVTGEAEEAKVEIKDPKDVSSDSLQNPSDEDAGYSGHKGEGYQAQLIETCQDEEAKYKKGAEEVGKEKNSPPNIITYVNVEPANCSDSDAPPSAIGELKERGCAPEELLADSLYGSDDNVQKASAEGVDLIAPTMGKPKSKESLLILDDFWVDEESGEVTSCPAGERPCEIRRVKDDGLKIYFDPETCECCDHRDYCCVGLNGDHKIEYTPKQLRLARRREAEESDEFREKYRWRSGIEAVNAKLKRMLGMGRLRVRGLGRVRLAVTLKVLGWNIFQAARA